VRSVAPTCRPLLGLSVAAVLAIAAGPDPARPGPEAEGGGFSWGAVGAAVAAALFALGFIGYLYLSHHRQPDRLSVYEAVRRRLDEERSEE
jgi:hypothetical protein